MSAFEIQRGLKSKLKSKFLSWRIKSKLKQVPHHICPAMWCEGLYDDKICWIHVTSFWESGFVEDLQPQLQRRIFLDG